MKKIEAENLEEILRKIPRGTYKMYLKHSMSNSERNNLRNSSKIEQKMWEEKFSETLKKMEKNAISQNKKQCRYVWNFSCHAKNADSTFKHRLPKKPPSRKIVRRQCSRDD